MRQLECLLVQRPKVPLVMVPGRVAASLCDGQDPAFVGYYSRTLLVYASRTCRVPSRPPQDRLIAPLHRQCPMYHTSRPFIKSCSNLKYPHYLAALVLPPGRRALKQP